MFFLDKAERYQTIARSKNNRDNLAHSRRADLSGLKNQNICPPVLRADHAEKSDHKVEVTCLLNSARWDAISAGGNNADRNPKRCRAASNNAAFEPAHPHPAVRLHGLLCSDVDLTTMVVARQHGDRRPVGASARV